MRMLCARLISDYVVCSSFVVVGCFIIISITRCCDEILLLFQRTAQHSSLSVHLLTFSVSVHCISICAHCSTTDRVDQTMKYLCWTYTTYDVQCAYACAHLLRNSENRLLYYERWTAHCIFSFALSHLISIAIHVQVVCWLCVRCLQSKHFHLPEPMRTLDKLQLIIWRWWCGGSVWWWPESNAISKYYNVLRTFHIDFFFCTAPHQMK